MSDNHIVTFTPGTDDAMLEAANYELAKVVGDYLMQEYPGYLWRVNADIRGGIINILNGDVSYEMGCTLMVADLVDAGAGARHVKRAGGEILERAKLHRGRMREHEIAEAKRDIRGNIINLD